MTRVEVCCGVGGTGKTTTAAALGVAHAHAGARTVVLTIDPARRLADALGAEALGNTPIPVEVSQATGTLHAMMLDRKATWDGVIRRFSPSEEQAERLIANRYYRAVSTRLTGSHEYMAVEKLHELVSSGQYDVVVVDTPPARHVLDFFEAPERIRRVFDETVLAVLMRPSVGLLGAASRGALGLVHRLAGEKVIDDIAEFFRLIADLSTGFRRRHAEVAALLSSERTTYWLVATADAPERNDLVGFLAVLRERGMQFGGFLLNRCAQAPPSSDALQDWPKLPGTAGQQRAWRASIEATLAQQEQRFRHHQAAAARLAAHGGDSRVWQLPEIPGGLQGVEGLAQLAAHLPTASTD